VFTSSPIASVIRRQTAAPELSPFAASSCVRIALSTSALISIALEHQLSDTPNVDVRYHARKVLVGPLLAVKAQGRG
jgi:hypothetical protein